MKWVPKFIQITNTLFLKKEIKPKKPGTKKKNKINDRPKSNHVKLHYNLNKLSIWTVEIAKIY